MIDLDTDANITENRRRSIRARMIDTVPESEMLVFSPKDPKYTITVFTDIDCGYCRRLHSQIAEYNRLGIRVRYLFYPAHGPGHRVLAQGRSRVVLGESQRGAHAREERRGHQGAEVPRRHHQRATTSSARSSAWRHAGHFPARAAKCCRATRRRRSSRST